jgi:glyoxylase-like metal-dependent hydrolase (beta-lactamase superfamily II)
MDPRRRAKLAISAALVAFGLGGAAGQDVRAVLDEASRAMGAATLEAIQYSGSGWSFTVGQAPGPGAPWPRFELARYVASVNYAAGAMREETLRHDVERPPRGGGAGPFNPATGQGGMRPIPGDIVGTQVRDRNTEAGAMQLALTPHGFLKAAAAAADVRLGSARGRRSVSFSIGRHTLTGTLDEHGLVDRIETRLFNNMLGDMLVEAVFSGYRDHAGVKFPARIEQRQAGHPTLDLTIAEVMPGSAAARGVTPAPRREGPAAPPLKVEAERIADGVWFLNGGAPVSVLVEFRDHVVVIEAPQGDERTEATVAAVKALTPGKPIRYVVNTHHHFDHSGGVRAVVAEGITLLTHEKNKAYFERILKNPFVLAPDRLAKSPRAPMIEGVGAKRVLTDGSMTLELHQLRGNLHDEAMLVGYLPRTRMLIQSDAFHPRPGAAPLPAPPPFSVNLLENIERLELDVAQLVQVHGGVEPFAQLLKAAGRQ